MLCLMSVLGLLLHIHSSKYLLQAAHCINSNWLSGTGNVYIGAQDPRFFDRLLSFHSRLSNPQSTVSNSQDSS